MNLSFSIDNYSSYNDFMNDIARFMGIAIRNGYEVLFSYEDCGIYTMDFVLRDKSFGDDFFMRVSPEEAELVEDWRQDHKDKVDRGKLENR